MKLLIISTFFFPFSFFHNLLLWIGNLNWSSDVLLAFSKIFIYLFERYRDTQWERDWRAVDHLTAGSLCKFQQQLELCLVESRKSKVDLGLPHEWQGCDYLSHWFSGICIRGRWIWEQTYHSNPSTLIGNLGIKNSILTAVPKAYQFLLFS